MRTTFLWAEALAARAGSVYRGEEELARFVDQSIARSNAPAWRSGIHAMRLVGGDETRGTLHRLAGDGSLPAEVRAHALVQASAVEPEYVLSQVLEILRGTVPSNAGPAIVAALANCYWHGDPRTQSEARRAIVDLAERSPHGGVRYLAAWHVLQRDPSERTRLWISSLASSEAEPELKKRLLALEEAPAKVKVGAR